MLVKLKYLFRERVEFTKNTSIPCYSVTKKGIIPQLDTIAKTRKIENRKIIYPNDYIFNSRSSRFGSSGLASSIGSVASVNFVIYPISSLITMDYMNYYFKSPLFIYQFYFLGKGIVDDLWSTHYEQLKELVLILPPLNQQLKKSSFLTLKCSLIHQLLSKIDLLLKKLGEYQEALLYDTLVHQKAPTTIIKLKYLSTLKGRIGWQALTTQEYQQQGAYLVTGVNIQQGVIDWSSCHHVSIERYEMDPNIQLQEQDLIITKDGTIGKVALIQHLPSIATLNSGLMLIRKKSSVFYSEKYLYYLLSSFYFHDWYRLTLKPNSTILHLYQKDFLNFPVLLSPLNVQQELCTFLDHKMTLLIKLQSHYQSLKVHLGEYQTSLLYETFQHLS